MNRENAMNAVLVILLTVGLGLACSSAEIRQSCKSNPFLKTLLRSSDSKAFNDILIQHGPVTEEEIPCIIDASTSWSSQTQINAASLIVIAKGEKEVILAAEKKMLAETKLVEVWAKIMEMLIYIKTHDLKELAALRPDMVAKALEYENADEARLEGKIQSTGLKAGVLADLPGMEDELMKRLDSQNADILEVAIDAMPDAMTLAELPRLTQMLADYEGGKEYEGLRSSVFRALMCALVRTEQEEAFAQVKKAVEVNLTKFSSIHGTRAEFLPFRNKIVFLPGDYVDKFCYFLIRKNGPSKPLAYDLIASRIWKGTQEPTVDAVQACIDVIENGELSSDPQRRRRIEYDKPSQQSCERLFHFIETGEFLGPNRKGGRDAIAIGKKWLSEHK